MVGFITGAICFGIIGYLYYYDWKTKEDVKQKRVDEWLAQTRINNMRYLVKECGKDS